MLGLVIYAVLAADGAVWSVSNGSDPGLVRKSASGATSFHPIPFPPRFVRASSEALWVAGDTTAARIDLSGNVLDAWVLPVPVTRATSDATGNLWLNGGLRLAPDGTLTEYAGSTVLRRRVLPPFRAEEIPVPEMMGFLLLSLALSLAGVFRLFGG